MSREENNSELRRLEAWVGRHPGGVDAAEIREGVGFEGSDRTLQRRLGCLEEEGRMELLREVVETELDSLHRGNIARYRIRPERFEAWTRVWK